MNVKTLNIGLLALNLVVLAALVLLTMQRMATMPAVPATVAELTPGAASVTPPAVGQPKAFSYTNVATASDWRQWVNQLRAAGVPTRVLARLVQEGFNDAWQKRQGEAQAAYMRGDMDVDGLAALNIEHDKEQETAVREALGDKDFKTWDLQNTLQGLNLRGVELSASETNALYELEKQLRQRLNELELSKLRGEIDQAGLNDQEAKAQADHDQQLKALLGDERYATMQGTDEDAGELRRNLQDVNASSDQFAAMLAIQNNWNSNRQALLALEAQNRDGSVDDQIKALDDARDQEFQRVLGTNGFEKFQAEQDSRYTDMERYAGKWGISDADIDYVYRTIRYYEKSVQDYQQQVQAFNQQGQAIDPDTVKKNLQQFSRQTEQGLRNYLGDDRLNELKQNGVINFNAQ